MRLPKRTVTSANRDVRFIGICGQSLVAHVGHVVAAAYVGHQLPEIAWALPTANGTWQNADHWEIWLGRAGSVIVEWRDDKPGYCKSRANDYVQLIVAPTQGRHRRAFERHAAEHAGVRARSSVDVSTTLPRTSFLALARMETVVAATSSASRDPVRLIESSCSGVLLRSAVAAQDIRFSGISGRSLAAAHVGHTVIPANQRVV